MEFLQRYLKQYIKRISYETFKFTINFKKKDDVLSIIFD